MKTYTYHVREMASREYIKGSAVEKLLNKYADLLDKQGAKPVGWLTSSGDNDVVFSWDKPHPADDPNPNPVYLAPQPAQVVAPQGAADIWPVIDRMIIDAFNNGADEGNLDMLAMHERYKEALKAAQPPDEGSV